MSIFRDLTAYEQAEFRAWARANYAPFTPIQGLWHPVVQEECTQINLEASEYDFRELEEEVQ